VTRHPHLSNSKSGFELMMKLPRAGACCLLLALGVAWSAPSPAKAAACDFAPVKQAIDQILDTDAVRGAKFRDEVADGADSTSMVESLVDADMQDQMDICRFQVGEYLTKRGYPPSH
jgi:hypothetical protein